MLVTGKEFHIFLRERDISEGGEGGGCCCLHRQVTFHSVPSIGCGKTTDLMIDWI